MKFSESFIDSGQKYEVELSNVFLISDWKFVAVVIDDGGQNGSWVNVFSIGGDHLGK
jgi:hypothetical protein